MIIVIPMAGSGQRFVDAGYMLPKPFIFMRGKPLIMHVIDNLVSNGSAKNIILIAREQHVSEYGLSEMVYGCHDNITIKSIPGLTAGAVNTVLEARGLIANDEELVIANSDQLVLDDDFLYNGVRFFRKNKVDAGAWCFLADHPKWSYCEYNNRVVSRVHEKKTVGRLANTGIYYWKSGSDFVSCAEAMIAKNIRVNGEFYVAPVMNEVIEKGGKVLPYMINNMVGLGTPEDYENYLAQEQC